MSRAPLRLCTSWWSSLLPRRARQAPPDPPLPPHAGKNAQRLDLFFVVEQSNSHKLFEPFFTNFALTCPITGEQIGFEFFFIGFQIPMKNDRFDLEFPDLQFPFTWKGTVTSTGAKG